MQKALAILSGCIILAIGINFFLVPHELLDGGVIGIALILHYLWGMKIGWVMLLCSIPIFLYAWYRYRPYFYNSIVGMILSSLMIDVIKHYEKDSCVSCHLPPLFSSIIGGILVGTGIGIMLRYETSTGGTDLLALFLSDLFALNVGIVIFFIDAIIVFLGGVLISQETFLLSVITILSVAISTTLLTWRIQT
ncbi:YitT family protein [Ferviditalea candida]|uniref:YitT family protein n=1 Tax=Ferviditalea candida TaxID=3108399 RepID=A0ABU5ZM05_9BACL|nr:YitT family protein [Paenibacillaceae bacterium T2]